MINSVAFQRHAVACLNGFWLGGFVYGLQSAGVVPWLPIA